MWTPSERPGSPVSENLNPRSVTKRDMTNTASWTITFTDGAVEQSGVLICHRRSLELNGGATFDRSRARVTCVLSRHDDETVLTPGCQSCDVLGFPRSVERVDSLKQIIRTGRPAWAAWAEGGESRSATRQGRRRQLPEIAVPRSDLISLGGLFRAPQPRRVCVVRLLNAYDRFVVKYRRLESDSQGTGSVENQKVRLTGKD